MHELSIQHAFELAMQHQQAGRLREAEQIYRQILARQPQHAHAMHFLGVIAHKAGKNDAAVDLIRHAITLGANSPDAYNNLALALKERGQFDEAIAAYRQAAALNPALPEIHYNLGIALNESRRRDEAIAAFRQAIALRPNYAKAYCNLGNILNDKGDFDGSIAASRQALALNGNIPEAHMNLGNALREKGQLDESIAAFRQAIAVNPSFAQARNNLGIVLKEKGHLDEAISLFRQAIALEPAYGEPHINFGNALRDAGQLDAAIAAYRQAIALRPDLPEAHSNLLVALQFHPGYSAAAIADEHRNWDRQHAAPLYKRTSERWWELPKSRLAQRDDRNPSRRLRIGYVSPDLRNHVVGRNLLPLLQNHDRREFEITCYAHVFQPDEMTHQLRQNADAWRSIVGVDDDQVARQICQDKIDILVDLALHSANNRLLVFARKPAPMQVSYLGYCGSTGLSAMDFRFSDPHLDPPDTDLFLYIEKTVRLPRTYWCYQPNSAPAPSPTPAMRNGFVTFGCLNNFAKVSPITLNLWARILMEELDSRMIIHALGGAHLNHVRDMFLRAGVAKDRLVFIGKQSCDAYTQTYSQIDIALDPFPYGGGITTCDALWMGVPVVTLSGQTAVGRGGRSILTNLGLAELIAFTHDQYSKIAIDLARDWDRLDGLRRGMRDRMLASPLMDAQGFARDVEAAYRQMWRTWCETACAGS